MPLLLLLAQLMSGSLLVVLILPLIGLSLSISYIDIIEGLKHPMFRAALGLSLRTTFVSITLIVVTGLPLAWWLSSSNSKIARITSVLVDLPVIIPPAVVGVSLLQTFGRHGLFGPILDKLGLSIPFTEIAVVLAQLVVSAPFFVQAATNAFRKVDPDMILVARSLGASPAVAFLRIALPIALPGLVVGASLAWARALGEFGATLLFAGNMTGRTQTMPLAIFTALESDIRLAVVFSLALIILGAALLLSLQLPLGIHLRLFRGQKKS